MNKIPPRSAAHSASFIPKEKKGENKTKEEKDWKVGYYLLAPACIILALVSLYPLLRAILTSFYAKSLLSVKWNFIGLEHYRYLLTSAEFWHSFGIGIIYTFSTVSLQLLLGIITALLLNRSFKGRNIARGCILFPYMLPSIVAVISWRWMLYDISGVLNYIFIDILHLRDTPITFSGSSWAAMTIVVLISVWRMFPFVTLCCLARLQAIPLELYEAAKVDGATAWHRFWFITLPQLKGIIFVVILLRGIWMFNEFDTIWLLTEGGPNHSTETVPIFTYITAFGKWNMGRGSAVAVITFIILAIVFMIYSRFYRLEES